MDSSDSDSDMEIFQALNNLNRYFNRPYVVRERENHFDKWDDIEYIRRFRVSKKTTSVILGKIENEIRHPTTRNDALSALDQLLLTLRFYATGCMQQTAGDFSGVHQTTAGRTIKRVTEAIAAKSSAFLKLPLTPAQHESNHRGFHNIARFPKVYGALDCTHVRMQSPGGYNAEHFRNRKGYFSLNVQALCGPNLEFLNVVARWPGASHDSTIFYNSRLCAMFESGQMGRSVILGDAGYALKNYLLTPLSNHITRAEKLYNESHIRTRNCIERCFGVWKKRFPVLSVGIKANVELVQDTIIACAVLHNLCVENRDEVPILDSTFEQFIDMNSVRLNSVENTGGSGSVRRQMLINGYFNFLS